MLEWAVVADLAGIKGPSDDLFERQRAAHHDAAAAT
jgi:hypothetical protein